MAIKAPQSHVDNFYVIASYVALEVLQINEYFQDLPVNWKQIIQKIKDKLSSKEQSARFEESLTDIAPHGEKDKTALPDAIKQLISTLNCTLSQTENPHSVSFSALDKLSRAYTPCADTSSKLPLKKQCSDEKLLEERCNTRPFGPVN